MKRLSMIMVCLFAMMAASLSAKAQEVTINLFPGWNWISYPNAEMQDVNTALGDFVPVNGDIILSQYSSSTYVNGYWRGGVTHFMPGWGYMYYSNRTEIVSFVFGETAPQLIVTTAEPTEITANSATCGGNVASGDGNYVSITLRGICWGSNPNPSFNDNYVEVENGIGSFTVSLTELSIGTTYYVRAFAVMENVTFYGEQKTINTKNGIPVLTTADITNIESGWATSGGDIIDDGGVSIIEKGVCWSTSPNPTINDSHTSNGAGTSSFISSITGLNMNTIYYVRAYATTTIGTGYGDQKTFMAFHNPNQVWVDLGLPSGLLWATCNLGADYPEDYGDYITYGGWDTYQCRGIIDVECNDFGNNSITMRPNNNTFTENRDGEWHVPTIAEWRELLNNTTNSWTVQNGVNGRLFTASNGNCLFLPAAGNCLNSVIDEGIWGNYWSSTSEIGSFPFEVWTIRFNSDGMIIGTSYTSYYDVYYGFSVRPVCSSTKK